MADRESAGDGHHGVKRQKMSGPDPTNNPYLAHMYPDEAADEGHYENGYADNHAPRSKTNGAGQSGGLRDFKRHATTSAQAKSAEDGPNNAFNGNPLSQRYFGILKTRRGLPVHAQR